MSGSTFANYPAALANAIQQGFLNREFEEGLDSILAYRRMALTETINARIGETLTRTRKGRTAPQIDPVTGVQINANLDNSLSPQSYDIEQYTLTLNSYAGTQDVNMMQEEAGIADQVIASSRNNGVAAAQTLERLAKIQIFAAYNGGNTFVRGDLGAPSTTQVWVDDIRGFMYVTVNGVLTPVSGSNTLTVYEYAASSTGVTQSFKVTGAIPDTSGASLFPGSNGSGSTDGIAGVLTITGAGVAPVTGDAIVAQNSASVLRPNGKRSVTELSGADVLTMNLVLDSVAYLRNNGVPALDNGNYACLLDNVSLRQLFSDQQFAVLFAGSNRSAEYRSGDVFDLLGVTFVPTTEAYVQQPVSGYINATVRRPIVMGAEALIQGNFEGLDMWLNREGVKPLHEVMMVNDVAQILRPPLDRLGQVASLSWTWVGGFVCPTDITATTTIVPTASNAMYKRAVVIETAS